MNKYFIVFIAMALICIGCHRAPLSCRSEYLYPDYLASEKVLTPDPYQGCFYGQQVVIYWHVPAYFQPTTLKLHVRYGSRDLESFSWPVTFSQGYRVYRIINHEYWCKEGIVSYKAELYHNDELLTDWAHHLWTNILDIAETF